VAIKFHIPGPLREFSAGTECVEIAGSPTTLREGLDALFQCHPGLRDRIQTEGGEVRPHINIFVDRELTRYTGELATPLKDGLEIWIIPAISGGAVDVRN
jgi:sulfur-carrier protein